MKMQHVSKGHSQRFHLIHQVIRRHQTFQRVDVQLSLGTQQACRTGSLRSRLPGSPALEFLRKNEMSLPEPAFFCFLSPGETWTNVSVLAGNGLALGDEGVAVPEWGLSVTRV